MKHETLRQHIEGVYETKFWGQPCTCDPKLIETVFGDGRRLIYYTPLATRPNYYIVRVGSDWDDDVYIERMEEVYEAIEADFGNADDSQYDPETGHSLKEWEQLDWPAFHDGGGCYGFTDWPERVISKRRARKLKRRGEANIWRIRGSNQYRWKPALFGASALK